MKTQARHGALFLALTTLATLTLSCGSGTETPTETTTAVPSADTTTTLTAADIIGFPTEDNGDTTIRILMGDHSQYEFMIEEQSGGHRRRRRLQPQPRHRGLPRDKARI